LLFRGGKVLVDAAAKTRIGFDRAGAQGERGEQSNNEFAFRENQQREPRLHDALP
jgi:hypothetical protein